MPEFGVRSNTRLLTCHPDIQKVLRKAIEQGPDFAVICGHRSVEEQQKLFAQGRSEPGMIVTNVDGVNKTSKHNASPSLAVDIAPWPTMYSSTEEFMIVCSYIMGVAHAMDISLVWGGDWDSDWDLSEHPFVDLPHFELRKS